MEETNVTNELHQEVISSDDSKNEEEKLMPKMRTKCYTIQKYQVEQVEVEFYSDSDKEDDKE